MRPQNFPDIPVSLEENTEATRLSQNLFCRIENSHRFPLSLRRVKLLLDVAEEAERIGGLGKAEVGKGRRHVAVVELVECSQPATGGESGCSHLHCSCLFPLS